MLQTSAYISPEPAAGSGSSLITLSIRAFSCFNTGTKAVTLKHCPQKFLVLDITPCDTKWAHIRAAAANASRGACATRDVRSGTSRCAASTPIPSPRLWRYVIRELKQEVRSVFGPQLTVPAPSNYSTAAGYLIIHATEDSQEANLLKSILSNLTILKHPVSLKLPTAQNKSWCSAISDTSKYTRSALSALF